MMEKSLKIDPFNHLDAYQQEAFKWANDMWMQVSPMINRDDIDHDVLSIAFAKIYSGFLYVSMNYLHQDFTDYLQEFYYKDDIEKEWDLMWKYIEMIYEYLRRVYENDYKIYETLASTILISNEDDELIEPYDYSELDAFAYVLNGFVY